jgi:hypothetical protein
MVRLEWQAMEEYWQDRRVDRKQVACAWALVVVILAVMLAITSLSVPDCPHEPGAATRACENGTPVREANADRQH